MKTLAHFLWNAPLVRALLAARFAAPGPKPTRGPTELEGIVADASALGVDRSHLWRVLKGQRESQPLMRRYRQLKRSA